MIKIEASRFFSQKSTNCPMGRSSLFEPCLMIYQYKLILYWRGIYGKVTTFGPPREPCEIKLVSLSLCIVKDLSNFMKIEDKYR